MFLSTRFTAGLMIAATLTFAGSALAVEGHNHGSAGTLAELTLNQGAKWATDAPLRKGMAGIRDDLAAALPAIHRGTLSAKRYATLAGKMHGHVEKMIASCKLTPEADAQLHLVLAEVMAAADLMKSGPDRMSGAVQAIEALDAYGRHFAHPGWESLHH